MLQKRIEGIIDLAREQKVRLILSSQLMPPKWLKSIQENRIILGLSSLLGIISMIGLREVHSSSCLIGIFLGSLTVCILPWLIILRRCIWSKRYPEGGKWMKAAAIMLWISLFVGPVVTGGIFLWDYLASFAKGMSSIDGLLAFLLIICAFYSAYIIAPLAFLIQLWRDQWHPKLTFVTTACLFLLFIYYIRMMG